MSAIAVRSIFLLGILLLIFLATFWAWSGTAQGASLDVTKTADTDDEVCDADCSLREAIEAAISGDTINIPIGTYTLTIGTQLTIDKDLTLNGAGSGDTVIQAATSSADATSRVLSITGGTVSISGVTVQNGNTSDNGGGISNSGTLTLNNSTVSDNTATDGGGGIYNWISGTLTLADSTISGNSAEFHLGGGIFNFLGNALLVNSIVTENWASASGGIYSEAGSVTLTNSTISSNTADSGGGIYAPSGIMTLTTSTISGNSASFQGGGIFNSEFGIMTLTNSTISANSASFYGGGIDIFGGTLTLNNSTVISNTAGFDGGGIRIFVAGTIQLVNTIVAVNSAATGLDCFGSPTSLGYNLIGDDTDCGYTAATGDLVGDGTDPIDPLLSPLQDNGGPTETHALLAGSPAIDAIPIADCNDIDGVPVATDQWGVVRPQGPDCDMGAYELEPPIEPSCVAPPADLVSWWPGDGNSNDIIDGNDATLENGTTYDTGMVDQAFSWTGRMTLCWYQTATTSRLLATFP